MEFDIVGGTGYYIGRGVGGGITGRGADRIIIDDPIKNREEAESETYRNKVWNWYISTLRTRLQPGGKIVMLLTRWHEDDLAGRLIEAMKKDARADRWRVVSFPAIFERSRDIHRIDSRAPGEPLWPDMFGLRALEAIKATLGDYDWSALYMQRPTPAGGAKFKREWLSYVDTMPLGLGWVRYWDLAVSVKEQADYTVGVKMGMDPQGIFYVADVVRGQWEWPEARKVIIETARIDGRTVIGVEAQAAQKGLVDDLRSAPELHNVTVRGYTVDKDKLTRALPWFARAQAGKVKIVLGLWNQEYAHELVHFTGADDKHDDQVDATSGAYRMLAKYGRSGIAVPGDEEKKDGQERERTPEEEQKWLEEALERDEMWE